MALYVFRITSLRSQHFLRIFRLLTENFPITPGIIFLPFFELSMYLKSSVLKRIFRKSYSETINTMFFNQRFEIHLKKCFENFYTTFQQFHCINTSLPYEFLSVSRNFDKLKKLLRNLSFPNFQRVECFKAFQATFKKFQFSFHTRIDFLTFL